MSPVALGDSVFPVFSTSSPTTGAAVNADSLPTATVEEDGVAMGYAPTITNTGTGRYRVTIDATVGNGFEAGKRYCAFVSATVGGIAGSDALCEFEVVAQSMNDSSLRAVLVEKLLRNKMITDPATGVMTLYDDDGVTPLLTGNIFEDAAGLQAYRSKGAERRERLA